MGSFFLLASVVAAICMTGFGVIAYTLGRAPGLSPANPDGAASLRRTASDRRDPGEVRVEFPRELFGYEKSAVDAVVGRLGTELAVAALRIGDPGAPRSETPNDAWDVRGSATTARGDTEESTA